MQHDRADDFVTHRGRGNNKFLGGLPMKKYLRMLSVALTVLCLLAGQCVTAADPVVTQGEWNVDYTVGLNVNGEYEAEIMEKGADAFDFRVNEVIITQKSVSEDNANLSLLLIFDDEAQVNAAVSALKEDARFTNVYSNLPLDTRYLKADSYTVKVGETITLSCEGELNIGTSTTAAPFETIEVMIEDYDPQHEYTVDDFPQYAFASVEKVTISESVACFRLKLENPGYYNFYRAINALANDPNVTDVHSAEYVAVPDVIVYSKWEVSDTSVAEFTTSPNFEDTMVLQGLKPGTVTVTYTPTKGYALLEGYDLTCEITVVENDAATEPAETSAPIETGAVETGAAESETAAVGTTVSSPKTGDKELAVLCIAASVSLLGISTYEVIRYRRKKLH
jgi:hypothetical protein